jgi:hypothetical protein
MLNVDKLNLVIIAYIFCRVLAAVKRLGLIFIPFFLHLRACARGNAAQPRPMLPNILQMSVNERVLPCPKVMFFAQQMPNIAQILPK